MNNSKLLASRVTSELEPHRRMLGFLSSKSVELDTFPNLNMVDIKENTFTIVGPKWSDITVIFNLEDERFPWKVEFLHTSYRISTITKDGIVLCAFFTDAEDHVIKHTEQKVIGEKQDELGNFREVWEETTTYTLSR